MLRRERSLPQTEFTRLIVGATTTETYGAPYGQHNSKPAPLTRMCVSKRPYILLCLVKTCFVQD